ncbi:unnamed protein product [Blepharisma stoltei]|uniref:Uncharacterized protein n=1 Tax=Blepharisma stoltei TaxID=1481888 RepID=A0AAU9IFH9_9CILI|nr:unnamed protein product [Blepharisma stoltei]
MEAKDFYFPAIHLAANPNNLTSGFETNQRASNLSEIKQDLTRVKTNRKKLNGSQSVERMDFLKKKPIFDELKQALLKNRESRISLKNNDESRDEEYMKKSNERAKNDIMINIEALHKETGKEITLKMVNAVLKSVEILLRNEVKYQNEAKIIMDFLNRAIFIEKEDINTYILDHLHDKNIYLISNSDKVIPYFYLYQTLADGFSKLKIKYEKSKEISSNKGGKLMKEIEDKEALINQLNKTIFDLTKAKEDSEKETANLLIEFKKIEEELNFYVKKSTDMEITVQKVRRTNSNEKEIIKDLEWQVKRTELDYDYFYTEYQKLEKEHKELKAKYENVMASYTNLVVKLKQAYDGSEELEKRISELTAENSELYFRSNNVEDLTPRPDLSKIISFLHIKRIPTRTSLKVNAIVAKLCKSKTKNERKKTIQETKSKSEEKVLGNQVQFTTPPPNSSALI